LQGLVWTAEPPKSQGGIGSAHHPGVLAVADGMGTMPPEVVEGDPLRKMGLGSSELCHIVQGVPEGIMGLQAERRSSTCWARVTWAKSYSNVMVDPSSYLYHANNRIVEVTKYR
jgi:hypothetical protein